MKEKLMIKTMKEILLNEEKMFDLDFAVSELKNKGKKITKEVILKMVDNYKKLTKIKITDKQISDVIKKYT